MGRRATKKVEDMSNKELKKTITSLINNINKKRREFEKAGFKADFEHKLNVATRFAEPKTTLTLESGNLSKSKKELEKLSDNELKKLYTNLYRVQNTGHNTVAKYRKGQEEVLNKIEEYVLKNDKFGIYTKLSDAQKREVLEKYFQALKDRSFGYTKFGSGDKILEILNGYVKDDDLKEVIEETVTKGGNQLAFINKFRVNRNGKKR